MVLRAPPGAGKSTRVPQAILDNCDVGGRIVVVQPRRVAARALARRVAAERGQDGSVGYSVRFDSNVGPATRIEYCTEGILLRRLQADPLLDGIGVLIFDEFHERSLNADLALALSARVRAEVREDLSIVVMSATLNPGPLIGYLNADALESEGRMFPVEVRYRGVARRGRRSLAEAVCAAVSELKNEIAGDILVFLPGVGEIHACAKELKERGIDRDPVPLYGALPPAAQDRAISPATTPRVILSTNIAETSVTIEGVRAVVDSGLVRRLRFDPATQLNRLQTERVSASSAEQRAGRAGRNAPGVCVRLWSESLNRTLDAHETPDVERTDLSGALLSLFDFGETNIDEFPWFQKPSAATLSVAMQTLVDLDAVEDGALTKRGRELARLPLHPRLGVLLLEGALRGVAGGAAMSAALLSERDPVQGRSRDAATSDSDLVDRVEALFAFAEGRRSRLALVPARAEAIIRVQRQLLRIIRDGGGEARRDVDGQRASNALGAALAAAFPRQVAQRRASGSAKALLASGRGVELHRGSSVRDAELFVCLDIDGAGGPDGDAAVARMASAIRAEDLPRHLLVDEVAASFDAQSESVRTHRRRSFLALVLREEVVTTALDSTTMETLIQAAQQEPVRALGLDRADVAHFLSRARFAVSPDPDGLVDAAIAETVRRLAVRRRSYAELRRSPVLATLKEVLGWNQCRRIDELAPEAIASAAGSRIRLDYDGEVPVMAVRIQEMFGLKQTPCIGPHRTPVLLHLLAPNYRPQQVTRDLASFWQNAYPEVRKELRRRYSKHHWPEDPVHATPTTRTKRRRPTGE